MKPSMSAAIAQRDELNRLQTEQSRRSATRMELLRAVGNLRANMATLRTEGEWIAVTGGIAKAEASMVALADEALAADRHIRRLSKLVASTPATESQSDLISRLSA